MNKYAAVIGIWFGVGMVGIGMGIGMAMGDNIGSDIGIVLIVTVICGGWATRQFSDRSDQ